MTATSGPGLSLMSELHRLAGTAEIPCVIVDAQRGGPSTGLPTKTEQSDLQHALYGGHGEAPRVRGGAASRSRTASGPPSTRVNYAERYQVPVILLTDQGLATRLEVIHRPDPNARRGVGPQDLGRRRRRATGATSTRRTPSRRWACPASRTADHVATGIEHDEIRPPGLHARDPRRDADQALGQAGAAAQRPGPSRGPRRRAGPRSAVIGFGSTYGPVREAVDMARADGLSGRRLLPARARAVPAESIAEFTAGARSVVVPEVNFTGQFARLVRGECGIPVRQPREVRRPPLHGGGRPRDHHQEATE